jgi:hypothetical protein
MRVARVHLLPAMRSAACGCLARPSRSCAPPIPQHRLRLRQLAPRPLSAYAPSSAPRPVRHRRRRARHRTVGGAVAAASRAGVPHRRDCQVERAPSAWPDLPGSPCLRRPSLASALEAARASAPAPRLHVRDGAAAATSRWSQTQRETLQAGAGWVIERAPTAGSPTPAARRGTGAPDGAGAASRRRPGRIAAELRSPALMPGRRLPPHGVACGNRPSQHLLARD